MSLWVLQRSKFWRQRTGVHLEWQFSLASILTAMTVVAVVAAVVPDSGYFGDDSPWLNAVYTCSIAVLTLSAVIVWVQPWHWLLRTAAVLAVALLLTALATVATAIALDTQYYLAASTFFAATYVVQALVLVLWLTFGGILPKAVTSIKSHN
jgi:hypothetical protein